jgi:glycosyltransferase involved in cell wall biosynthesis
MPVSILEAFASGTPVVTTAPEGIRYIVEHERTGLLCEPGDWRALAKNVTRFAAESAIRAADSAELARGITSLSVGRCADAVAKGLSKALRAKRRLTSVHRLCLFAH